MTARKQRHCEEAEPTRQSSAVICVHLAGWPCDMDTIMALAEQHDLKVIEDCAQAHGARYKGRAVGSIGHVGAWSFCQDKIMTTGGEGGMVTTNDEALWRDMWSFKDHGKSYEAVYERQHPPGFRWLHESFGTNWRMMETQAVIGRIQLRRMADWTARRTAYAEAIWSACRAHAVVRVPDFACDRSRCDSACAVRSGCAHAHYKCYVYVRPEQLAEGWSRDRAGHHRSRRAVLPGFVLRGLPGKSFRQHWLAPGRALAGGACIGRNRADVPGPPDPGPGRD